MLPGIDADSNPDCRRQSGGSTPLRQLLESAQFGEVMEAENGREAIDKAQDRKPDIVILDLVMPVMDGLVAARELSKLMPGVPLLMHTLHWSPQVELEAQKVGVRKVIAKADSKGLISAIQEILISDSPVATTGGRETAVPANLLPAETAASCLRRLTVLRWPWQKIRKRLRLRRPRTSRGRDRRTNSRAIIVHFHPVMLLFHLVILSEAKDLCTFGFACAP